MSQTNAPNSKRLVIQSPSIKNVMQYERGNHFPWKLLLLYCCSLNVRDFHDLNDEGFFYHHVNENSGFGKALVMMKKFHVTTAGSI